VVPLNSFLLELLVEHQWVSDSQAREIRAVVDAPRGGKSLEIAIYRKLIEVGEIDESALLELVAEAEGIHWQTVISRPEEPERDLLCSLMSADLCMRYRVAPIRELPGGSVSLAAAYPCDYHELEVIAHLLDRDVEVILVPEVRLMDYQRSLFHAETLPGEIHETEKFSHDDSLQNSRFGNWIETTSHPGTLSNPQDSGDISKYVDWAIAEAIRRRASDLHLEPMEKTFRIRCRVDGVLQQLDSPAKSLQGAILSRLKLLSHLDIAEKRLPQDGRFHLKLDGKHYDFRVSTVPSTHGEGIVIRILDKEQLHIGLAELGMMQEHRQRFEKIISAPDGIFLVTGPTGSGKSTTLYAALHFINDPSVKILTVEDPVEYHIEGINQVQVRPEVNMTFSSALRSMLRQAPNIIMVGEIRDCETAEIAINASLTGHTVFSTLHTNDAPSAITRLMDMGAKPFLVAATLRAVMAQRLVRRIPEVARLPYLISDWQLQALGPDYEWLRGQTLYHAGEYHRHYHGRVGVFEMFEIDETLGEVIYRNATLSTIRRHLRVQGFRNMRHDGVNKALQGWTSLEEVLSVTPGEQ